MLVVQKRIVFNTYIWKKKEISFPISRDALSMCKVSNLQTGSCHLSKSFCAPSKSTRRYTRHSWCKTKKKRINNVATLTIWWVELFCRFPRYSRSCRDSYRRFFFGHESERLTTDITTAGPIRPSCLISKRVLLQCAGITLLFAPPPAILSNCVMFHLFSSRFQTHHSLLLRSYLTSRDSPRKTYRSIRIRLKFQLYSRGTPLCGDGVIDRYQFEYHYEYIIIANKISFANDIWILNRCLNKPIIALAI